MTPTGAYGASALRPDPCFLAPPCLLRSGPTTSDPPAAARASAAWLADEDSAASLGRMPAEHHESHPSQGHHPSSESAQCLGSADISLTSANRLGDGNRRR